MHHQVATHSRVPEYSQFFKLVLLMLHKKVIEELEQPDRTQMIMSIDAQSLASLSSVIDSPLLVRREDRQFESTAIP